MGDVAEAVNKIKNEPGKDIWLYGGAALTTSLLNLGLVGHYIKTLGPIHFGGRLMIIETQAALKLIDKYFKNQE